MPRGRAWQHSDDLFHQAWLKVLQGKRPPAEKWPRQSGAPKPGQPPVQPQPKIRGLHPDVKVSVARDRIAKLEAAIAAVGDEDETAPKLKEGLRKARQQAQIPPIEVRVKSCEQFLDRARKNVLKAQEEVSKAQQFLMEAQKRHEERVTEVTEAERRLIMLQTRDHEGSHSGHRPSRLGSRVGRIATDGERIADREHRAPGSCKRHAVSISSGSARTPIEGGFCSRMRRRHLPLDARSSSRHSGGNVGRERSRGGKVVPRDGLRSCRVVNTKFVAFDGMQCSPVTRRVPTYGHRGVRIGEASHPGPFHRLRRCRDQCDQHALPSSLGGDDYSVDDTVVDSS